MSILERQHWIFDMDGTLTAPIHDFEAIRRVLGVPAGAPILEYIDALPEEHGTELNRRLADIESEHAAAAAPRPGAAELLDKLHRRGARFGLLTRNSLPIALRTLDACGLRAHFDDADVLGREDAPPKPSPQGIMHLLERWGADTDGAIMVGDYWHDIDAGRAAGVATVCIRRNGDEDWAARADLCVDDLMGLLSRLP